jgi:hypothetical protein
MAFAIKAAIENPGQRRLLPRAQDDVRGKHVAVGDTVFLFAAESDGGTGLVASGVVTAAAAVARTPGVARQTPRVSLAIRRTALAKRSLGGANSGRSPYWSDGRPETELNFKFYRQATNKLVGISEDAATFLRRFF